MVLYFSTLDEIFRSYGWYVGQWMIENFAKTPSWPVHLKEQFFSKFGLNDLLAVILITLVITLLRDVLTKSCFIPQSRHWKTKVRDEHRVVEHLWKISAYAIAWSYSLFTVVYRRPQWITNPIEIQENWSSSIEIPSDIYVMYTVQFGFYVHSCYATLYLEARRKDFFVMMIHHVVTLTLLAFSMATRHHAEGAVLLLLHDFSDIWLESWKLNNVLRYRDEEKHYSTHDNMATVSLILFVSTWFILRIILYPILVLHPSFTHPMITYPAERMPPLLGLQGAAMITVFLMNSYWFYLMIIGIVRHLLAGENHEIDDTREHYTDGAKKKRSSE